MRQQTVFVTGADRGLGYGLCAGLVAQGWKVFAGQFLPEWPELTALAKETEDLQIIALDVRSIQSVRSAAQKVAALTDRVDLLINNAGVQSDTSERPIRAAQDYEEMLRLYDVNSLGPLRVVQEFLPLMDKGTLKRLCFVSSEAGSITRSQRDAWFGYCMSKAALNMAAKNLFNALRGEGYTFRVYHPGWVRSYMHGTKATEADLEPEEAAARAIPFFTNPLANEDHLALIDSEGQEWPW